MRLKELIRVIITEEMMDVTVYTADVKLYGSDEKVGDKLWNLYTGIAHDKKTRLKALSKISKEGVGFRQRKIPGACSIQASLRIHEDRAKKRVLLYRALLKLLDNLESRELIKETITKEKGYLAALTALRNEQKESSELPE